MRLYNTMSRTIEDVVPQTPGKLGLYACGLTVYDYTHLGHLRKYTMDDVLVRTLRHAGFSVKFIQNVTDVGHLASDADTGEDKLEKGAKKYQKSVWDIAREFEAYFWQSMEAMGNLKPDVSCRATDHIAEQLEMVKTLEHKGFAYVVVGDGVYFDTAKVSDYGALAKLQVSQLQEGARVAAVSGKRNPTDFALWKFERPGENRAMVWPSPWAERSFPGWHIECSAMAMKYLGEQFEIHTGGIDHIPVHHTNEIAQAEAATGKKPFVRYWVHHNFLLVDGEKMSKSVGNFLTIDDVAARGFSAQALRWLFLTSHYRSEMNFTWDALSAAETSWQRLLKQMAELRSAHDRTVLSPEKLAQIDAFRRHFFACMEDDLKTPEAVAVVWQVLKSNIPGPDKYDLVVEFDEVLGLGLRVHVFDQANKPSVAVVPAHVQQWVVDRTKAKAEKRWADADTLRQQITAAGYQITDQKDGTTQVEQTV